MGYRQLFFGLLIVVILAAAATAGWWFGRRQVSESDMVNDIAPPRNAITINSFADCAAAGYPIMESYPRQCAAEGRAYVEDLGDGETVPTADLVSEKGVVLRVEQPASGAAVQSPLQLKGEVPGTWTSEGSFSIVLQDHNQTVLAEQAVQLDGDWMTEEYVPFSATVTFANPTPPARGSLIIKKANPSGLPSNDDQAIIPLVFQ